MPKVLNFICIIQILFLTFLNFFTYNEEATQIAYEHNALFYGDYISGNALLLEGKAQLS
jgi:hypothetical protein